MINLYKPNVGAPNFIKYTPMDLKTWVDPNTVAVGDFKLFYQQKINHSDKKINKEILDLNGTIDIMDLTGYSILHQYNIHSSQQPLELSPK
jgi:hypothetical protein